MKTKMSMNIWEYTDDVVFDLLCFLYEKMNSNEALEKWYSECDYPDKANISLLYDKNQGIRFHGNNYDTRILLINNRLLLINSDGPNYVGDNIFRTYFDFTLLANADKFVINKKNKINGRTNIELNKGNEGKIIYNSVRKYESDKLPRKIFVTDLLKPISFEQLYERGHIIKDSERVKLKTKILKK